MKVKKSDTQKNVTLDTYFYTDEEIENMFINGEIWFIKELDERESEYDFTSRSYKDWCLNRNRELRINLDKGDDIEIVRKDGYFKPVVVHNSKVYFIVL